MSCPVELVWTMASALGSMEAARGRKYVGESSWREICGEVDGDWGEDGGERWEAMVLRRDFARSWEWDIVGDDDG